MKRYLLITTILLVAIGLRAQSSYSCRYWYDEDFANATTTAFSGGNWQAQLDVGDLSLGLHTLHFSMASASQQWNPAKNFLFMKTGHFDMDNVVYHCWFDQDMESQQTADLGDGVFFLNVDDLSFGLHTVHVLLEGSALCATKSYLFLKPEIIDMDNLTYHCWFDQDMEHQVVESFSGGSILMDVSELRDGLHTLHFLLESGAFTTTKSYLFMKVPTNPDGDLHYRCWFNQDAATVQTGDVGSGVFQLEVSALPVGQHSVTVQLDNGTLSSPQNYMFYRGPIITVTANPIEGGTATVQANNNECTLTATPNEGYEFVNWTVNGNAVSTQAVYNFTATADATYVANFVLKTYDITAEANPSAGGTVNGTGIYQHFSTCTLTASANTGYHFVNWTLDGEVISTEPAHSFTVTGASAFVANFELNAYEITASANPEAGGTVEGAGTYNHFSTCTLTATANTGYHFVNWTLDGEVVSTEPTYSFTVTEASNFVANFELNSYEITATANPEIAGTVSGAGTYQHFSTCTLTATANPYGEFLCWKKNGAVVSNDNPYSFTVTEAGGYVAEFNLTSCMITAEANPAEGGTMTGAGMYTPGATCTLTATANEGYTFVNWTRNGAVVSVEAEYSFTVTEEASFTANFTLNSYAITAMATPSEGGTVTGSGTYYHFESATLTAIANEGYHFVNWTKDGEVVSSVQTYSFEVTEAADFVANFAVNAYNVFAMANPSVGGTVSGAGAYEFGETATLTAMPNANYAFVNWTENGVEVSTEAIYSFIVEGSRSLVANFSHDYYWTVNPFAHESTMTIIGIVQINGEEQHSNLLEVGAFSGDECRGREWLTDQYYVDLGHYLVFLTVYGDDDSADEITFRLYDHAVGEEIDKTCVTTLLFESDAIYGSYANPFAINFIDANVTQTANLSSGWNWWSSYIELSDNSLEALQDGLGASGMMIKSQNDGYASYLEGFGWYGSLAAINNENTYQIRASEDCAVGIAGTTANPAEHPIELHSGWTWVGYPVNASMGVEDALAGIEPLSGDMLKSQNNGFASYLEGFGWYGSLSILDPGMGLMYKSNNSSPITLVYPNNGTRNDLKANQTADNNHWQPNLNTYPDNMSVMAVVELDGEELALRQAQGPDNYELAVFANGECRGSARLMYVEPLNRYMAFLTVAGDEPAELHFGLYNAETGEECIDSDNVITYVTNAVIGSFVEPYVVSFRGNMGIDEWVNSLQIFPNPVERGQKVSLGFNDVETGEVQVEIINVLGAIVETRRATSLQTITTPETAGVYTLRITVEGKGMCYRKLIVK